MLSTGGASCSQPLVAPSSSCPCCPGRGNPALHLPSTHPLRSSPKTSQEKRRRVPRILLQPGPCCSGGAWGRAVPSRVRAPAVGSRWDQHSPVSFREPARCPNAFPPPGVPLGEPPGTLAKRDLIQKGLYPKRDLIRTPEPKCKALSQRQAQLLHTNCAETSPAPQPQCSWDLFLCAPTPAGSRCFYPLGSDPRDNRDQRGGCQRAESTVPIPQTLPGPQVCSSTRAPRPLPAASPSSPCRLAAGRAKIKIKKRGKK